MGDGPRDAGQCAGVQLALGVTYVCILCRRESVVGKGGSSGSKIVVGRRTHCSRTTGRPQTTRREHPSPLLADRFFIDQTLDGRSGPVGQLGGKLDAPLAYRQCPLVNFSFT